MSLKSIITKVETISANSEAAVVTSSQLMKLAVDVLDKIDKDSFDSTPELKVLKESYLKQNPFYSMIDQIQLKVPANNLLIDVELLGN